MNWELSVEKDIIFVVKSELLNQFKLLMGEWKEYLLPTTLKYDAKIELQQFIFHIWLLNEYKQHECLLDPYKGIEFSVQMTIINFVNRNDLYNHFIKYSSKIDRFLFSYYFGYLLLEKFMELMNSDGRIEEILDIRHAYFEAKAQQQPYARAEEFLKIQAFGTKILIEYFKNIETMNSLILKALSQLKESKEKNNK